MLEMEEIFRFFGFNVTRGYGYELLVLVEFLKRIFVATLLGMLIGYERDKHGRAAGLRTHTLVSVGSALFTLISLQIAGVDLLSTGSVLRGDAGRIAAQVVTGIGFLGAGTIVKDGFMVKGLTTAACLWFAAAIGMACGINQLIPATLTAVAMYLFVLWGKNRERKFHRLYPFKLFVYLSKEETACEIYLWVKTQGCTVTSMNWVRRPDSDIVKVEYYIDVNLNVMQPQFLLHFMRRLHEEKFEGMQSVSYYCMG